jgi:nucleoside-diphosphate-sugar epimerase
MRVLIRDGAGFIGSHLAERVLAGGAEVVMLAYVDGFEDMCRRLPSDVIAYQRGQAGASCPPLTPTNLGVPALRPATA